MTEKSSKTEKKPDAPGQAAQETPQQRPDQTTAPAASAADFLSMHAAHATGETYTPTGEELKQRNKRSLAIAGAIVVFIVLVFTITVLRIGGAAG
ncbi:hypothetical protein [Parvularcula sp. IMCC14364]|uniref:hypothetical protein n=1 Tax=Parvularcula sp. IMCC14364 TaxID=3067902 RepID=UPI002741FEA9|nr:hypothetical protein [Parvularcula sp. IMCC14364]